MKNVFLLALCLIITTWSSAQQNPIKKTTISLETGVYHRGLLGVGFTKNFAQIKPGFFSVELAGGVGIGYGNLNNYAGVTSSFNIGAKNFFLSIGYEAQYYRLHLLQGTDKISSFFRNSYSTFEGINTSPVIGFTILTGSGFTFKARGAAIAIKDSGTNTRLYTSIGYSFGYSF